ncbi:MAG: adenosine kinase [Magnetococcales bacterium]|nr:adenosine kinase [Magnetococcales bacterium]
MKKYNVYGIGHALVDMEFLVEDSFLQNMELQKGSMMLVDEAQQKNLLQAVDNTKMHRSCGGSASNTMIGLAQFGGRGFHSCKVADDETGRFFAADMQKNRVENSLATTSHPGTTGKCLVLITPDAERTMCTHLGISETFSVENLSEEHLAQAEYLYIEGYLVSAPSTCDAAIQAAQMARKLGVKVALTFSDIFMIKLFREGMDKIIDDGLDLLFCNENEALEYTGKESLQGAAKELKKISKQYGLTLGAKGATLYDGTELISIPGVPTKAIDSNGAGDLFAGTFLYGITNGLDIQKAGELACKASSVLVTQYGARLQPGQANKIIGS